MFVVVAVAVVVVIVNVVWSICDGARWCACITIKE